MSKGSGHSRWRFLIAAVCLAVAVSVPAIALGATLTPVYRFYNTKTGTHFYTASETEKATVQSTMSATYTFEGVAYNLETDNPQMNSPLYRFYNKVTGTHFYTASSTEKDTIIATMAATFTYEGVAYNVSTSAAGNTPVYRFYNKKTGTHFYTASESEKNNIQATLSGTYTYEGPAFYLAYTAAPPTGDTTPPATTSNATTLYRGPATILFSATDNAGGSGVAITYYTLDGFGPVAGTMAYASGFGSHTVEYWSVDKAGNEETPHNIATFSIVSVHASPAIAECTDCHTKDIMSLHNNNCAACHATGVTPSFVCSDCHTEPADSLLLHPGLATAHDASAQPCVGSECHAATATAIHGTNCAACHAAGVTPTVVCATCHTPYHTALPGVHDATGQSCIAAGCHVSTDAPTIHAGRCLPCHAAGQTPSVVCSSCHESKTSLNTHPGMPVAHDATGETCVAAGCHDTDVATIHDTMLGNGLTPPSCEACHNGDPLTTVCSTCHGDYASIHPAQGATVHKVTGFCYTSGCHVMTTSNTSDAALIHSSWANAPGCAACHATGVTPKLTCFDSACHGAGGATVETVHAYAHPSAAGDLSAGCTISECHGSEDVLAIDPGHTGCSCHTANSPALNAVIGAGMDGDYAECYDCHDAPFSDYHVGDHATATANIAGTKSSACVSCHGDNVMAVGSRETAGGEVTVPADPAAPVQEHAGCSCHDHYGLADLTTTKSECVECHTAGAAPHGFTNGDAAWNPNDFFAASGHNTEAYGVIGAHEKFDGSEGVTLYAEAERDFTPMASTWEVEAGFQQATAPTAWVGQNVTAGDTTVMTSDWDFPTVNVFWQAGDPDAPADAMYLNESSVVTCEDCHTGLLLAGPHGADENFGLDADYPADYSYAELTKRVDAFPSGIKLRKSLDYTTQNTGLNVITSYDDGMTVICSKCHDLQNYQSGTTVNNPLPFTSTGSGSFVHNAETYVPLDLGAKGVYVNGSTRATTGYAVFTDTTGAMVPYPSAKILSFTPGTASVVGTLTTTDDVQVWSQGAAASVTVATVGSSNTAHSSHHQDTNDGSAQCVGCHLGVPHGWKRPRLLVNGGWDGSASSIGAGVIEADPAPYKDPDMLGTSRTNGGVVLKPNGYNGMGMLTLSAVDNHNLWAGSSVLAAGRYDTGAAYWSEPSCQACNDHAGEDGVRLVETP